MKYSYKGFWQSKKGNKAIKSIYNMKQHFQSIILKDPQNLHHNLRDPKPESKKIPPFWILQDLLLLVFGIVKTLNRILFNG